MKKLLFIGLFLFVPKAEALPIAYVQITTGTLQAGTTWGFFTSSGTTRNFAASTATITNLSVTSSTMTRLSVSSGTISAFTATSGSMTVTSISSGTILSFTSASSSNTVLMASSSTITNLTVGTGTFTGGFSAFGTQTNDSAGTGFIGQYISSVTSGAHLAATSNQFGDLVSLLIPAGDWDVAIVGQWTIASGVDTWTGGGIGLSSTAGNSSAGLVSGDNRVSDSFASSNTTPLTVAQAIEAIRVSIATPTTYYFKYRATFSIGTPTAIGRISARRVR